FVLLEERGQDEIEGVLGVTAHGEVHARDPGCSLLGAVVLVRPTNDDEDTGTGNVPCELHSEGDLFDRRIRCRDADGPQSRAAQPDLEFRAVPRSRNARVEPTKSIKPSASGQAVREWRNRMQEAAGHAIELQ